jgi:hypothetical protein
MFKDNLGVFILLLIVLGIVVWLKMGTRSKRNETSPESFPYKKASELLSPAERTFYDMVRLAVGGRYTIFAKVRMRDVLFLQKGTSGYQAALNKVAQKHLDFVLCAPDSAAPELVIELDDRSHQRPDRQDRDAFVDNVLKTAGLSILHIPARSGYNQKELADLIEQAMRRPGLIISADRPVLPATQPTNSCSAISPTS